MLGFVAITDNDWFRFLRAIEPPIDEVNFWKPSGEHSFRALQLGEPIFFKLKAPHNAIGGFGYFAHFSKLPVSMAWEVYREANGAGSFGVWREQLMRRRARLRMDKGVRDFWIGCVLVNQPVFFQEDDWIRIPENFSTHIEIGKRYDLRTGEGERIWLECLARAAKRPEWLGPFARPEEPRPGSMIADAPLTGGFGSPMVIRPRLGQRSFRIAVLDSYGRRCTVTNERTLPALEAAHIRDYSDVEAHSLDNGILFRADIHKLFDSGYVTVTPDHHFLVSGRIKEEFENGRDYYRLHGTSIRLPEKAAHQPLTEALIWHNETRYLG
jgi:putative restriction endonuclease